MAGVKPWESSKPWFTEFKLLNVKELIFTEMVAFGHRNLDSLGRVEILDSRSRSSQDYPKIILPKWKRNRSRAQSKYTIPVAYNRLPVEVRRISNFKAFRKKVIRLVTDGNLTIWHAVHSSCVTTRLCSYHLRYDQSTNHFLFHTSVTVFSVFVHRFLSSNPETKGTGYSYSLKQDSSGGLLNTKH